VPGLRQLKISGSGGMAIEIINDAKLWDEAVDHSPYGRLFHKWEFLKIIEKHTGYRLYTFGSYKGEKLIGVFPLFYGKTRGLKTVFSPPPRTGVPYLGFVISKEYDGLKQSKKENELGCFTDEMEKKFEELSPDYLLINLVPNFMDARFFSWNRYSVEPNYTYVIDLNRSLEEIWNGFHRYLRRDIKSAEGSGFRLSPGEDISFFYNMQSKRYDEQGMIDPLISQGYFSDLVKAYPENIQVYYLYDKIGEIIGSLAVQEYKDKFTGWMGLAKTVEHANEILIWSLIQLAKAKDFKKFEIIGANVKNQCPFKSKFNPGLEMGYTIHKKNFRGSFAEWAYVNLIKNKLTKL
jgi:hypothetical protein